MEKVIINAELSTRLSSLSESSPIYDEGGRIVGIFTPRSRLQEPQMSREELDRRLQETTEYSTAEVLAHLETL